MTLVAAVGLAVNAAVGAMLRAAGERDLNVRAALFHVVGDALGRSRSSSAASSSSRTARGSIRCSRSSSPRSSSSAIVGVMRDATDVLLEGVPGGVDAADSPTEIEAIGGVDGVHDLHVWTIGSGSHALSAHVFLDDRRLSEANEVLREIDRCLQALGINHVTIQFECDDCPVVVRHT